MLTIAFNFLGGRYHATPWGRHVNEADVAWPPEPWRLARAFIATWHRKLDPGVYPKNNLKTLLGKLASIDPVYHLPAAVHFHTRHYMPGATRKDKPLIFDAFVRVASDDPLIVCWRNVELKKEESTLLDTILEAIGYLGRAESWVEARRLYEWDANQVNCMPGSQVVDMTTGEITGETVALFAPQSPDQYAEIRTTMLETAGGNGKKQKAVEATLPPGWLDALSLDTSELQRAGWSQPPAARKVQYVRPLQALAFHAPAMPPKRQVAKPVTTLRFVLFGKPLPRIEDSVKVGEWMRRAAMSKAGKIIGEKDIPPVVSGHELGEVNRHGHAFWLPEDADGDGHIDHFLVHAPGAFDPKTQSVLVQITRLWDGNGAELKVIFEAKGQLVIFKDISPLVGCSAVWRSSTPYLHPWHLKKKFGVEDQIRRECRERGLPEPETIEVLSEISVNGKPRRSVHFYRFRSKRGLIQPDRQGRFLQLTFAESISGPLALGFGCHFGLGMFRPEN